MKMRYISQIQSGLRKCNKIYTRKTTSRILDGSYVSVFKGLSMNFDELREYVPGDEVKDIDWKASARTRRILIKQYIAEKKHNVMIVMDANRKMLADTTGGSEKRNVALLSAGTIAYLVNMNGDYISSLYATEKSIKYFPFRLGFVNIENILEHFYQDVSMTNKSDINKSLQYIIKSIHRKMITIIVTDMDGINIITETTLKRLRVMQDVLIVCISNAAPYGENVYSLDGQSYMSRFFTMDKKLQELEQKRKLEIYMNNKNKLRKYGINFVTVENEDEIGSKIVELFENHKFEKRR